MSNLYKHHEPKNRSDRIALAFTKFLRFIADTFFRKKYGHRAVVLETVAAVPGMVAGMLTHLRSLRKMEDDRGWIKVLLEEAENERMHLMTFIQVAKPTSLERFIIIVDKPLARNLPELHEDNDDFLFNNNDSNMLFINNNVSQQSKNDILTTNFNL